LRVIPSNNSGLVAPILKDMLITDPASRPSAELLRPRRDGAFQRSCRTVSRPQRIRFLIAVEIGASELARMLARTLPPGRGYAIQASS
jgi:hypothetical protein